MLTTQYKYTLTDKIVLLFVERNWHIGVWIALMWYVLSKNVKTKILSHSISNQLYNLTPDQYVKQVHLLRSLMIKPFFYIVIYCLIEFALSINIICVPCINYIV
jgi:multisubunit Na+/H+ antiporter MnhE subunit